ncbi:MAG: response regulator [Nibricoccus sp.]
MNLQPSEEAYSGADTEWRSPRPKVLVVDDEPLVLSAVFEMLERSGYHVVSARSAEEAVAKMLFERFDIVLTDYRLGAKGGDFVALTARQSIPPLPVVIMTGLIEELPEWLRGGSLSVPIIRKPFRLADLLMVLDCAIMETEVAASLPN